MAKLIFILSLMTAYVVGVHAFTEQALTATHQLASFYTATNQPDQLLSSVSK